MKSSLLNLKKAKRARKLKLMKLPMVKSAIVNQNLKKEVEKVKAKRINKRVMMTIINQTTRALQAMELLIQKGRRPRVTLAKMIQIK